MAIETMSANRTAAVILDTRRAKKNGLFPVKIRITVNRKQWYFPAKLKDSAAELETSAEMYEAAQMPRPRGDAKDLKSDIDKIKVRAQEIANALPVWTPAAFERAYYGEQSVQKGVFEVFAAMLTELHEQGRIGTWRAYNDAANSLRAFIENRLHEHRLSRTKGIRKPKPAPKSKPTQCSFAEITTVFLKRYEATLLATGASPTTVAMHCRALRTVFNSAIKSGDAHPESYPFGRDKYRIPTGRNEKIALSSAAVSALLSADTPTESEKFARDMWEGMLLCNGLNPCDFFGLRRENLAYEGDLLIIRFQREKNKRKPNPKTVTVSLRGEYRRRVEDIFRLHGTNGQGYIFPIFAENMTPAEQHKAKQTARRVINRSLRKLSIRAGIPPVSCSVARHSLATAWKRAGIPISAIADALGHKHETTTQNYLDGFDAEAIANYSELGANILFK